jgi:hypothetical protein
LIYGIITIENFYGPPGFGETPESDQKIKNFVLILENEPLGDNFKMQIINNKTINFEKYIGKKVLVKGKLFSAHTAYHNTPILIEPTEVIEE